MTSQTQTASDRVTLADVLQATQAVTSRFGDDYWLERDTKGGFPEDFYQAMAKAGWLGVSGNICGSSTMASPSR